MKSRDQDNNDLMCFEIEFFEKLLENKLDFIDALIPLAEAYTKAGRYDNGLAIDKRLVELKPDDAIVHYNLACSLSLIFDIKGAIFVLEKAVSLGYEDFEYMNIDNDLKNVRTDKVYEERYNKWIKRKRG